MSKQPLSSWTPGPVRTGILDFVARVTTPGSDFLPDSARIAVFDNDGTLWQEKPFYIQAAFMADRIRAMAADNPDWRDRQPYKAVLEGDLATLSDGGMKAVVELVGATHSGMSVRAFDRIARKWLASARHPQLNRLYRSLIYLPMLELLEFLRTNGFRTYIVSAGGVDFMRACAEELYGVPPEQVIGSTGKTAFQVRDGETEIVKLPEIDFVDDGPAKPLAIQRAIGRQPVFAAGNSDGDLEMLQWVTSGNRPGFGLLLHHTDAEREWAYDRDSKVGRLDHALDLAPQRGWHVIDMKRDWTRVHVTA